jgi:hypothetical protein
MGSLNNWGRVSVSLVVVAGFMAITLLILTQKLQGSAPSEVLARARRYRSISRALRPIFDRQTISMVLQAALLATALWTRWPYLSDLTSRW